MPPPPPPPPHWTPARAVATLALFLAAAFCEVGGGWCVWRALHGPPAAPSPARYALIAPGVVLLAGYGFVAAVQPCVAPSALFGRTFAVYGGVFVVFSYGWGWAVDGQRPDVGEEEGRGRGAGWGRQLGGTGQRETPLST